MVGDPAGEQPPRPAAPLQPDDQVSFEPIEHALLATTALTGTTDEDREESEAASNLARLTAERHRINKLRAEGFQGSDFEVFQADLVSYGYPVIRSWIRRRLIYALCADKNRPVTCPEDVRDFLAGPAGAEDRQELALETVARALRLFRERALIGGEWDPDRGASLSTYFVGACLLVFSGVFRPWLAQHQHWHQAGPHGLDPTQQQDTSPRPIDLRFDDDPADIAVDWEQFRTELAPLPARLAYAVAAVAIYSKPHAEVAAELGTTEDAVKQMLYRYRRQARRRQTSRERT